jgi:putative transposase
VLSAIWIRDTAGAASRRAFSYSKSQVSQVILYIHQQELHHRKKTFQEEYINMLTESGIDFDKRYIFKEPI